jgi:hypothetical protein
MSCLLYSPVSAFTDHAFTYVKSLELHCILADSNEVEGLENVNPV